MSTSSLSQSIDDIVTQAFIVFYCQCRTEDNSIVISIRYIHLIHHPYTLTICLSYYYCKEQFHLISISFSSDFHHLICLVSCKNSVSVARGQGGQGGHWTPWKLDSTKTNQACSKCHFVVTNCWFRIKTTKRFQAIKLVVNLAN